MNTLVAARFTSYLLLLAAAGIPFYGAIRRRKRYGLSRQVMLLTLAVAAMIASVAWAIANVAAMAGLALSDLDAQTVFMVLKATPLGAVLEVRLALLLLLCGALLVRPSPRLLCALALPALATAAWAGHAGAGEGMAGSTLRLSDMVHLCAAALWLGALLSFLTGTFVRQGQARIIRDLGNFARTGTVAVAALALTGSINAWLIAEPLRNGSIHFPSSPWAFLIGVKIALFFGMLGCAAANRWYLVPTISTGKSVSTDTLKASLLLETGFAVLIIAIVALVGQMTPT